MASSTGEPSFQLLENIKRQVEFYFGDANMRRDQFLIRTTKLDDGWVPMTTMLRFRLLASMSRNVDVILKALESSELIEISSDRTKIRRSIRKPILVNDAEYSKVAQKERTVCVKGFPRDSDIQSLVTHFETTYPVEYVFLKKDKIDGDYFFNGCLFLQFKTISDAKEFVEKSSVYYLGNELTRTWAPESYYVGTV